MIKEFQGKYRFLSNFWPSEVIGPGYLTYATVENAYQAAKSLDPRDWEELTHNTSPFYAKKYGRTIKIREDWDQIKLKVMEDLLRQKFAPTKECMLKLIDTFPEVIQEGNNWGDTFWGVDLKTGAGWNHMGNLLMEIRNELVGDVE